MMRSRFALLASTALVLAVVALDRRTGVGPLIALWFLAVVPGTALSRLVRLPETGAAGWVVSIAASFALEVVVTEAMLYAHVWTPTRGLTTLCVLSGVFVGAERGITRRRARGAVIGEPRR